MSDEVPFGTSILTSLNLQAMPLETLVKQSRRYDPSYLAWEMVRKGRNPFFVKGTGFEGYFVGKCETPEETVDAIVSMGQRMLESILRLYRYDWSFRSRLMKTLLREKADPKAMYEWSAQLGAATGRLRCNLYHNLEGLDFQFQTYRIVARLPQIHYYAESRRLMQNYAIVYEQVTHQPRMSIERSQLNPSVQDAWLVAETVGAFGHPILREYLGTQSVEALYR